MASYITITIKWKNADDYTNSIKVISSVFFQSSVAGVDGSHGRTVQQLVEVVNRLEAENVLALGLLVAVMIAKERRLSRLSNVDLMPAQVRLYTFM